MDVEECCISDTYEPGSSFKIVTTTAALEAGVLDLSDKFFCPDIKVGDRSIRCHKAGVMEVKHL